MTGGHELVGQTALICGGTAGIGLSIAKALLAADATVVVNGRSAERGAHALRQLDSPRAFFEAGDCGSISDARGMVQRTAGRYGAPTILVASGGAAEAGPGLFETIADDVYETVVRSQLLNRIFAVKAALPFMKERGGSIIIVGTDAGRHATVGEALHGAMGAAKIMLTKTLAREFARWNIRVNGIALTITSGTEAFDAAMARDDWVTQLYSKAASRFPGGRPPTAEEVARVALFFASSQSAQVTGQTLSVNGGLSYGGW